MNFLKPFYYLVLLFVQDLPRLRTLFFVGMGNCLPDTFFFSRIRAYIFILAGGHIKNPHTCIIRKGFFTENASNVFLGENVQINRDCIISGHGKTVIGDHVFLSYSVQIYTISHSGDFHQHDKVSDVEIGSNTVLYANTIVLPGSRIGNRVKVQALSLVRGKLDSNLIFGGNPIKEIVKNE